MHLPYGMGKFWGRVLAQIEMVFEIATLQLTYVQKPKLLAIFSRFQYYINQCDSLFAYCFGQLLFCTGSQIVLIKGMWGSLNLLELAMSTTLTKSRIKAFNLQQERCIYCELPMWLDNPEAFAKKFKITIKGAALFKCTAEHLLAKQDGGKDGEGSIVAACHFCNQRRHKCKKPKDPIPYKDHVTKRVVEGKWNSALMSKCF
jgi:hypothetical protein